MSTSQKSEIGAARPDGSPSPQDSRNNEPALEKPDGGHTSDTDKEGLENATQPIPDGGPRAWLVAGGASAIFFSTLGYANAFGIFQAYYAYHQLPGESAEKIAWIGSTQTFLGLAAGALTGPLSDRVGVWIICPAAVVYVVSIMLTSLCCEYWQFMLAQGILTGVAIGFLMFPAMSVISHWFDKKRGAAMGITVAGSSIGAVLFPIVLSKLLTATTIGFGWSVRIIGFLVLPFLGFGVAAIKPRLAPRKTAMFLWYSFRSPMYGLLIVSLFFAMIGTFIPLFMLPTYAITRGVGQSLAGYLAAVLNGASFFGRVIPGVLGDKFGRISTFAVAALSTGVLIFCWPVAKSTASIIAFAAIYGFCSGAIISGGAVALTMCADKPENVGTYMGIGMALASVASLIGPPVSGSMVDEFGGFHEVSYFAGSCALLAAIVAITAKWKTPTGVFGKS